MYDFPNLAYIFVKSSFLPFLPKLPNLVVKPNYLDIINNWSMEYMFNSRCSKSKVGRIFEKSYTVQYREDINAKNKDTIT